MKVFITGATGVLGRRMVEQFTNAGHEVIGLSRDRTGERTVEDAGGTPHRGDVFEKETLREGAEGADVIVHAATALPTDTDTTAEDWEQNDEVRLTGLRHLIDIASDVKPEVLATHSVVWAVRNDDGSMIDEDSGPNTDRTTESAIKAEELLQREAGRHEFDGLILRYGWLYGPESGQFEQIRDNLLSGDLPVIGSGWLGRGDTTVSLIHTHDAARAMLRSVESEVSGVYHVVDDEPVTTMEFFTELAAQLKADDPSKVPPWLAKLFVSKDMVNFMTNSFPTSNSRFKQATGWSPRYPTYRQGISNLVNSWRNQGEIQTKEAAVA